MIKMVRNPLKPNFVSRIHLLLVVGTLTSLIGRQVEGAIPPSDYLVKQFLKKRAGVAQIELKSAIYPIEGRMEKRSGLLDSEGVAGPDQTKFYETLTVDLAKLKAVSRISAASGGVFAQKSIALGKSESGIPELFFSPNYHHIVQQLRGFGIGIKTEDELNSLPTENERRAAENLFLKKDNQIVYWVIGSADNADRESFSESRINKSAWFVKDQFLLGKLLSNQGRRGQTIAYQMDEFRYFQEFPYPRKLVVSAEEKNLFRLDLVEMRVIPKGAAASSSKTTALLGSTDSVEESISSGDDTMDRWVRTFWNVMR